MCFKGCACRLEGKTLRNKKFAGSNQALYYVLLLIFLTLILQSTSQINPEGGSRPTHGVYFQNYIFKAFLCYSSRCAVLPPLVLWI